MIDRIIEFSGAQPLPGVPVRGGRGAGRLVVACSTIPLDAIPDLSDTQVIVYSRWDRSPDIIEDQVTYPIVTAMLGAPKVKDVRGFSDFGYSYVYIIFEDGTDIYWARSRTLEYLSKILPRLPQGVEDRTGAGRHRRGLGLSVRAGGHHRAAQPGGTALAPGLVPALPVAGRAGRGGSGAAGRLRAAVPGQRRSQPPGGLRRADFESGGGRARRQQRRRRPPGGIHRPRVHGARPRLRALHRRPGATSSLGASPSGVPDPGARRGQRDARPRHAPRRGRSGRPGRSRLRHRGHAPGRERAARDRPRQGQAEGDRAGPARRA